MQPKVYICFKLASRKTELIHEGFQPQGGAVDHAADMDNRLCLKKG